MRSSRVNMIAMKRNVKIKPTYEVNAWKYMRLSAILLVPLVWFHAIFTTLIIGPENINLDLVQTRWAAFGWRVYDVLLLAFAFSHGMNGLRQVLFDFARNTMLRRVLNIVLLLFWLFLSIVGGAAILGNIGN